MASYTINIPAWLDSILQAILLLARRLYYGYTFCTIPLTQGKAAIVDPDDYPRLSQYKWHAIKKGDRFYASRWETINGKRIHIYMHRQIMQSTLNPVP